MNLFCRIFNTLQLYAKKNSAVRVKRGIAAKINIIATCLNLIIKITPGAIFYFLQYLNHPSPPYPPPLPNLLHPQLWV